MNFHVGLKHRCDSGLSFVVCESGLGVGYIDPGARTSKLSGPDRAASSDDVNIGAELRC